MSFFDVVSFDSSEAMLAGRSAKSAYDRNGMRDDFIIVLPESRTPAKSKKPKPVSSKSWRPILSWAQAVALVSLQFR
jgi:hypothetical protein